MKRAGGIQGRAGEGALAFASGVGLASAVGVAVAIGLAWLLPAAAIVVVWPILFFVSGWWLVARAAPDISPVGRAGSGVVASVYLSAHLVNVTGTLGGGLSRAAVFVAVLLLLAATWVLARFELPHLAPPPRVSLRRIASALRATPGAWLLALVAIAVVGGVLALSAWHRTAEGWVSGGWNWSDFLVHVAIGKSLIYGNFPPQVPYFSGAPLSYHWFADFHGAIAAVAAGVDLIAVYVATNGLMAGVLALVSWELTWRISGDRRVALIAAGLVVFGGGMGWIRLAIDLANGGANRANLANLASLANLPTLVATNPYDNTWADGWPYFRIASILGTGLLPHRATALGLPGLVSVVLLVHTSLGRRPAGMVLGGVLAALLAPFHFFAFPATYLIVLLLILARREWRRPTWRRDAALFLAPAVFAIPFIVEPALRQGAHGAFRFVLGWSEARFGDGPLAVAFFYLTNLGLPFALALVALTRRSLPDRAFLTGWIVALFLLPNLIVVSAVEFDMNKYFQMMWIAVAIAAAWLMRSWPRPVLGAALAFAALSPALVAVWHVTSTTVALTTAQERAAAWIETETPPRSVFVTDAFINSPVDLAGRLRITTFGPYVANLGYEPDVRAADVNRVRCDGADVAAQVMRSYGARYLLSTGGRLDCGTRPPTDPTSSPLFETVYDADGVTIWWLRDGP